MVFYWTGANEDVERENKDLFGRLCAACSRRYLDDSESALENGSGCGLAKREAGRGSRWNQLVLKKQTNAKHTLHPAPEILLQFLWAQVPYLMKAPR